MGMTIQIMTVFGPKKNPTVQVTASGEPRVTELPADLSAALEAQAGARAAFDTFVLFRRREKKECGSWRPQKPATPEPGGAGSCWPI